jgi:hypothetical protein
MVAIALQILERIPKPIIQICGPISTGGKGSLEANIAEFNKAIFFFNAKGENVFNQIPFQDGMKKLKGNIKGYNTRILTEFYLPLFHSRKISKYKFLPNGKGSIGTEWEREQVELLGFEFEDLQIDWFKNG